MTVLIIKKEQIVPLNNDIADIKEGNNYEIVGDMALLLIHLHLDIIVASACSGDVFVTAAAAAAASAPTLAIFN